MDTFVLRKRPQPKGYGANTQSLVAPSLLVQPVNALRNLEENHFNIRFDAQFDNIQPNVTSYKLKPTVSSCS